MKKLPTQEEIISIINRVVRANSIPLAEIADEIGVNRSTVTRSLDGTLKKPSYQVLADTFNFLIENVGIEYPPEEEAQDLSKDK